MQDRITSQQDKHLGALAQPWDERGKPNKTFIQANPDAVKDYFTPDQLKELWKLKAYHMQLGIL